MKLGEKLRYLRLMEGTLRGLDREMSQAEVARAIRKERGESISQAYLSQIESGARPHMTNNTRMLLARFFKVHPGYLVSDPDGFHTELTRRSPRSRTSSTCGSSRERSASAETRKSTRRCSRSPSTRTRAAASS